VHSKKNMLLADLYKVDKFRKKTSSRNVLLAITIQGQSWSVPMAHLWLLFKKMGYQEEHYNFWLFICILKWWFYLLSQFVLTMEELLYSKSVWRKEHLYKLRLRFYLLVLCVYTFLLIWIIKQRNGLLTTLLIVILLWNDYFTIHVLYFLVLDVNTFLCH
jgi:hypothetical protein